LSRLDFFLSLAKKYICDGKYHFAEREKNKQCLATLGITLLDALNLIMELSEEDYYKGPENERNPSKKPGTVFSFRKEYEGQPLYIKLKLPEAEEKVIVISFHIAER